MLTFIRKFRAGEGFVWRDGRKTKFVVLRLKAAVVAAYLNATQNAFSACRHWCMSFDPGLHGRQDTLGLLVSSPDNGLTAYGPTVVARLVRHIDTCSQLVLDLLEEGKHLQRRPAQAEMASLHKAMSAGFNFKMEETKCSDTCIIRPLQDGEERVQLADGSYAVKNFATGEVCPELPANHEPFRKTASAWSDQGSTGMAGLNFLIFSLGYFIVPFFDMNHRVWNDLKAAFKHTESYTWRCVAFLSLVFNLNYNPFGKGAWFECKKDRWEEWCCKVTSADKRLREYGARIAEDLGWSAAPETDADFEALIVAIKGMQSFSKVGPSTKMMRWFAWFEAYAKIFKRELWAIKMILEVYIYGDDEVEHDADVADGAENGHEDPRSALNEMKKRYGSFKTAYKCITADIVWTAKCVNACTQPIWWINNERVKHVKTPKQVLQHEIRMTCGQWWKEVQTLLDQTLRSHRVCSELGLFEPGEVAAEHLGIFFDQVPYHP